MNLQLRYFARLRERFARDTEFIELPSSSATVLDLVTYLAARGGAWAEELDGGFIFRVAVNHELAELSTALHDGAEVAIFPPVTGG